MSNNIASERNRLGLNQAEMAEQLGVSRGTYIKYEKMPPLTPYYILEMIAEKCACSIDYLVGKTDDRLPREATSDGR